jgi:hypothetical protein
MIAPASFSPSITKAKYDREVIPAESTAVNVEFVCDNRTEHVVDVLFYRHIPQWDMAEEDIPRTPWNGPWSVKRGISTIARKGHFGSQTNGYFYFFGSVGGADAELLAAGYLFFSLRPTLVITPNKDPSNPSQPVKFELVHPMYKN